MIHLYKLRFELRIIPKFIRNLYNTAEGIDPLFTITMRDYWLRRLAPLKAHISRTYHEGAYYFAIYRVIKHLSDMPLRTPCTRYILFRSLVSLNYQSHQHS